MKFTETKLKGAFIIELEPIEDKRGYFSRTYCVDEFAEHGLDPSIMQSSISYNKQKYTLRGMHYQKEPHAENKIVTCISGSVQDVIIDLRQDSPTYKEWVSVELSEANKRQLYVPKGFAHGFLTLANDSIVSYNISDRYYYGAGSGLRYNDLSIGIIWEHEPLVISERDLSGF